ncbi:MAG: HD domain-containing protein [Candidatus Bathyarchaeota archaeon]|nr:HD domain-containing protein [Candidatus Termiticorpusculum sp.]
MKTKIIKDAVHGYIQVEEPYWKIIDTAEFQRLKWVEQTSFRVLYPSARHDRFIHSIGTYHLGQKAFEGFYNNCLSNDVTQTSLKKYQLILQQNKESFLLACLLHDIGHAPFSHTCEDLFNYQAKSLGELTLDEELIAQILANNSLDLSVKNAFKQDYTTIITKADKDKKGPSQHEKMSSIVIIKNFETFTKIFTDSTYKKPNLDLIIRSILGCCYTVNPADSTDIKTERGIKNCLIRLLNSSTVDVDKLDYITRDTLMSGYENVVLDIDRLLSSLSVIVDKDNVYRPAFKKVALSVIDNVINAKNAQAKWIVNHPVVLYEYYLLRKAVGISLKSIFTQKKYAHITFDAFLNKVFSSKSLSVKQNDIGKGLSFSLLSDIDLLFYMKNVINNEPDVAEYFKRDERKSPIWKSHEEYVHWLGTQKGVACEVAGAFKPLINHLNEMEDLCSTKKIDKKLYDEIKLTHPSIKDGFEILQLLDELQEFCNKHHKTFDFVLLPAENKFYAKIDKEKTFIRFKGEKDYNTYDELRKEEPQDNDNTYPYKFFYLYSKDKVDTKTFLEFILNKVHQRTTVNY